MKDVVGQWISVGLAVSILDRPVPDVGLYRAGGMRGASTAQSTAGPAETASARQVGLPAPFRMMQQSGA